VFAASTSTLCATARRPTQPERGATIDEVKMMLGHTQRSTTVELYSHLLDRGRRAVADRADAMFPRKTARG
jgi:hypothetical protein